MKEGIAHPFLLPESPPDPELTPPALAPVVGASCTGLQPQPLLGSPASKVEFHLRSSHLVAQISFNPTGNKVRRKKGMVEEGKMWRERKEVAGG